MARYFHGKEVELLAPAGTFEIFKEVIEANCDAVYFGGPSLNMRMMRKGYNLSCDEIRLAAEMAHERGKRIYVTVNNLMNGEDIEEAKRYLSFLNEVGPDGIISQDMAVFPLIKEMNLNRLPVHASVMMNVHNEEMIRALQELGVTRIVASREMDLRTAQLLQAKTGMEFEYFVHGDMCTVHGANCYYSSLLFGNSANRGRCMKPCRWEYRVKKDGNVYPTEYPLAAKDMNLYEHIPELIEAGITSFKIEGRMRDAEFLRLLVNSYGDAIDRYIADPVGFERSQDSRKLFENRKRDFSTAYAFGKPGLDYLNTRYEGTGKFYSTGKVFSTPTAEREMKEERIEQVKAALGEVRTPSRRTERPQLSVRVNDAEQAQAALEAGADIVYLAGDVFQPARPFTRSDIERIAGAAGESKVILGLPRMMDGLHMEQYSHALAQEHSGLDGLLVTNLGAMRRFRDAGLPLIGDVNLNVYNARSAEFYHERFGLERVTASLELPLHDLGLLLEQSPVPVEVIVHGSPVVMYLELDLYENAEVLEPISQEDNRYVDNRYLVLMTDKGENPVYRDARGRNHLALCKELCYMPFLAELHSAGVNHFRIEGQSYTAEQLRDIVQAYRTALQGLERCEDIYRGMQPIYAGYTLGALQFDRPMGEPKGPAEAKTEAESGAESNTAMESKASAQSKTATESKAAPAQSKTATESKAVTDQKQATGMKEGAGTR
ncbi:peptidase U32 family protein [Paenibacillus thiaminolyticus]|uniref:peptidase U32 family protein n=1 Tax=Paenibacillus thiaminolyticus TaxID=49283 RepID=UPI001F0ED6CF|nr:U32 family peptidase [Paenibacillus thiaminolyticus]